MTNAPTARLALADGSLFEGTAFGAAEPKTIAAEVVFNTAMSGYQESITDPSYAGQILVETAPLIGNTGVNAEDVESTKVQVSGFVVRELANLHSNYRANADLSAYLAESGVLGLADVDTRAIARRLRVAGVMAGVLTNDPSISNADLMRLARTSHDTSGQNLVPLVGCSSNQTWSDTLGEWAPTATLGGAPGKTLDADGQRRFRVLAMDCGAKWNILRHLTQRGCEVVIVPHDTPAETIRAAVSKGEVDGLFVSNGPGDPAAVTATIDTLRDLVAGDAERVVPTFGICLGHQLLSLAAGATTYKLKFGHRGVNQPVRNLLTGRVEITSQNHGYAVDTASLEARGGEATHVNLNDQSLAGFRMTDRPVFAVQHHPEASPGPHDANYLFDAFVRMMATREPIAAEQMAGAV
ncbi:MAG: glutamine-hydrolyzing carbamoyl-phosphate synthase small subunit [Phycisphaerales bacterium]